jgi:hypothetical protein
VRGRERGVVPGGARACGGGIRVVVLVCRVRGGVPVWPSDGEESGGCGSGNE